MNEIIRYNPRKMHFGFGNPGPTGHHGFIEFTGPILLPD
jgi:hypothetical protein